MICQTSPPSHESGQRSNTFQQVIPHLPVRATRALTGNARPCPAPPRLASGRKPTPGRPGPNGKHPPSPARRPGTAGHRNASSSAGEALRTGEAATAWPTPRQASTATSGGPRRSKSGGERLRQRVPVLAVPAPAQPGRAGPGAPGSPSPSRRFPVTTTTDWRRPRPGGPAASLRKRVRLCPPAGAPNYSREMGGDGGGPASRATRDPIGGRSSYVTWRARGAARSGQSERWAVAPLPPRERRR